MTTADEFVRTNVTTWWWLWLVAGFIWILVALVIGTDRAMSATGGNRATECELTG